MTIKFSDKLTKQYIILSAQKYHSIEAMNSIQEAFSFTENKIKIKINKAISSLKYILELEQEKNK